MEDKLQKLFDKKKSNKLSDLERDAKLGVVKSLRETASGMMGDRLKGLKKVTVASPDKQGLEKGLEMAKEVLGGGMSSEQEDEESEDEMGETPEHESMEAMTEEEPMDLESVNAKLAELMALKAKLESEQES